MFGEAINNNTILTFPFSLFNSCEKLETCKVFHKKTSDNFGISVCWDINFFEISVWNSVIISASLRHQNSKILHFQSKQEIEAINSTNYGMASAAKTALIQQLKWKLLCLRRKKKETKRTIYFDKYPFQLSSKYLRTSTISEISQQEQKHQLRKKLHFVSMAKELVGSYLSREGLVFCWLCRQVS